MANTLSFKLGHFIAHHEECSFWVCYYLSFASLKVYSHGIWRNTDFSLFTSMNMVFFIIYNQKTQCLRWGLKLTTAKYWLICFSFCNHLLDYSYFFNITWRKLFYSSQLQQKSVSFKQTSTAWCFFLC